MRRARLRLNDEGAGDWEEGLGEQGETAEEKGERRMARLMDAGLFMLQRVAVILGFVYSRSLEGQGRLRKRMKMEGREGLEEVGDVLREYALSIGEEAEGAAAEGGGAVKQRRRLRYWAAHLGSADGERREWEGERGEHGEEGAGEGVGGDEGEGGNEVGVEELAVEA